jgi:hypothetical protein
VFGLRVRSDIVLPELAVGTPSYAVDVVIRLGRIAEGGSGAPGYEVTAQGTLLNVPEVGRYLIRVGREIVVDPAAGACERSLRLFLLGSAFGALLHQRGMVPLHANAIDIGGRAVAFSGHSGAGKSTLAAWFHDQGYAILADDVCVIGFGDDGRALAFPGIPRLRLSGEALLASGRAVQDYSPSTDRNDKYDVPTRARPAGPLPLARIYMLASAEDGEPEAAVRRLSGAEAVDALISNTYRGGYVGKIGRTADHLAQCLRIARQVPIFEARRIWGFDAMESQARLLEQQALSP